MRMELDTLFSVASALISLSAVCVSLYSVRESRRTALTGTYFSEMANAYSDYLSCISEFVFRRGASERDALAAALYRLQLFASSEISADAQKLYIFVLDWASTNPTRAPEVDALVSDLGYKMREHLEQTRKYGRP
ncbi:hypothetical protein B5G43_12665 [Flavonifractor sp. An92]|uniref:hypothetical protein n=1 Tax=Flavonifractor sp. An92 TaxID=1965666 RepID=UPI000B369A6B|nr:hypothetical protein [Flavonifractor sp. An92]OUN05532.1 hypothetical protein B5G43_12665 [Flavonifractor sp. An92]